MSDIQALTGEAKGMTIVPRQLFRRVRNYLRLRRQAKLDCQLVLIRECVRQEVAAEFDRQKAAEAAIWADCFADGAAAEPKRQRDRVMRLASSRAALSILNGKSNI